MIPDRTRDPAGDPGVPSGVVRIALRGELDLASAHAPLETALPFFGDGPVDRVVIDLSEVTFIDSSGLGGLVRLANYAGERGAEIAVHRPSPRSRAVLELAGLSSLLPIIEDLP